MDLFAGMFIFLIRPNIPTMEKKRKRFFDDSPRSNLVSGLLLIALFLVLIFHDELIFDHFGYVYTVAYDFKPVKKRRGRSYQYTFKINGKEYTGSDPFGKSIVTGLVTKLGTYKETDKYLVEVPRISKNNSRVFQLFQLPDTTTIPEPPWDSIPQWVLDIPRLRNGKIAPEGTVPPGPRRGLN